MPVPKDQYYLGGVDLAPEVRAAILETAEALSNALTLVGPQGPQGPQGIPGPQGVPGAGFPAQFVRKLLAQQVVSSAVLVNDAELRFPVTANTVHVFTFVVVYDAHGTPDISFSLVAPAGAAGLWGVVPQSAGGGGFQATDVKNFGEAQLSAGAGLGVRQMTELRGLIVNGATPGNVQLQWAQNTANANPTTVHPMSWLLATRVT